MKFNKINKITKSNLEDFRGNPNWSFGGTIQDLKKANTKLNKYIQEIGIINTSFKYGMEVEELIDMIQDWNQVVKTG